MLRRKEFAWSLLVPTSMGVRITPVDRQPVHCSDTFKMQATSAETNVASIPAGLGLPVKVLTAFVKESPVARFISDDLRKRGFSVEAMEVPQGGPWGYRHQFNIADSGFGLRGPRVHNDRAGEVGRLLNVSNFDLDRIFDGEGVAMVHISGLIAALAPGTGEFCLALAERASQSGTLVSFDLNYRASFWKDRQDDLRRLFTRIASVSDILVGNEEDFQLALGLEGPSTGGAGIEAGMERFREMILAATGKFPRAKVFATTLRQVIDSGEHLWGAIMLHEGSWQIADPRRITVLDRIGGGDGFVGGLLYGILKGWTSERSLQFGWACGALATSFLSDYAQPADEEMVWDVWRGNARVKR